MRSLGESANYFEAPEKLKKMAIGRWGDDGKKWIDSLESLQEECERIHGIKIT